MENPEALLVLAVMIALPATWLWAEFTNHRRLRIFFGLAALILPYGLMALIMTFYNYKKTEERQLDESVRRLLDESIRGLQGGKQDHVLKLWQRLEKDYYPGAKPVMNSGEIDDALRKYSQGIDHRR
jgi:hypothetical protein